MTKGIIVSPANRGVQVVVTDENNVQLLVDSNRGVNLEIVPQPRIEVLVDKGVEGAQGPVGPQGPQGTAATVTAGTTTTGAAGTNAIVTNSGTSSAAIFDFTIPRGDTGATGATGAGVATGGTTGQFLQKASNANYDTTWSTITGTLVYQGSWNAATNTPTLTSSVGTNGYYYVVGTSGSTNLNGITDWVVGDWAIFNGSVWQKIDNTDLVSSVNGQTGVVVLDAADVGALAITNNLSDLANAATARTNLGLGSIATQDASNVAITGGTINNTTIGATTPSTGVFTTLTATGQTSLASSSGNVRIGSGTATEKLDVSGGGLIIRGTANQLNGNAGLYADISGSNTRFTAINPNVQWLNMSFSANQFSFLPQNAEQLRITHTSNAVNYVQVTGAPTSNSPQIQFTGSDAGVGGALIAKGNGAISFFNNGATTSRQFRVGAGVVTTAVNYINADGSATGNATQFQTLGTDTNIAMALRTSGTGAIDLAAGSSGVNISNGGTVTAITRTNAGGGYTTIPNVVITAPTTAGGVQATASVGSMVNTGSSVVSGGTGYAVGNTLTVVGGTNTGVAATLTVTAVSGGVITTATPLNFGQYTVLPTNPVSVTGGAGTGATFNLTWGIGSNPSFTITNAGSGYVEQPTVSFSGGGGSGAAAYATVGSGTVVKSLGTNFDIYTPNSSTVPAFRVSDVGGADSYYRSYAPAGGVNLVAQGATNANADLGSNGTGSIFFTTNGTSLVTQMRITHTASAVNYVQVTGAATGGAPTISAQGSNADIDFTITPKGTNGRVRFGTYTATVSSITGYIEIKDSGGTVRRLAVVS